MARPRCVKLATLKAFFYLDAYQLAVQSSGLAVHMPVQGRTQGGVGVNPPL